MNVYYPEPWNQVAISKTMKGARLARQQRKLLDALAPNTRLSLTKGVSRFKKKINMDRLVADIKRGKVVDVDKLAPWETFANDFPELRENMADVISKGAEGTVKTELPTVLKPKFRFDSTNPSIYKWIKDETGKHITTWGKETKATIDNMVRSAWKRGLPPRKSALLIRDRIGLNARQQLALDKYMDRLVAQGITGGDFDRRVQAEFAKKLKYRKSMIARTETMNALNNGHLEVWNQAAEQDLIDPEKTVKKWITAPGACEICEAMSGEEVPLNEPWLTPDGQMVMIPSEVHPNCNCSYEVIPKLKR